jgi:hypothetical protein
MACRRRSKSAKARAIEAREGRRDALGLIPLPTLMNTRALVELIVLNIGFDLGFIRLRGCVF